MKYELKQFQANALAEMLEEAFDAQSKYERSGKPQVISLTAPTGSGKTIIATSFIEDIFKGNEIYAEHPDSIFIWLSDSPELNEQSKLKIENTANKLRLGQCITIEADSFNQEYLEDGYIYFLNTQKLSKSSRLVKGGDGRDYTIWETLQNTIEEKSDRLFVIIDEAHRGMKDKGAKEATSTMQKFIKGSPEDGLSPFPVVIGMSATIARFNTLVGTVSSTIRPVIITPAEVRRSGLLKEDVFVLYPKDVTARVDMAVLQAATDDWQKKCDHWEMFYDKQKTRRVNPVFLVQVENGSGSKVSNSDLDEVIKTIEERIGRTFNDGEVVHAFGEKSTLTINGCTVRYEEPSRIDDNKDVRVVLFKDALATGWDCPRAESMVSFRRANDVTYIAQLLGRMLRTPLQQRVSSDEYLNNVCLFLPYFNQESVEKIVKELRDEEGGAMPTNVDSSEIGGTSSLTALPPKSSAKKTTPTAPQKHTEDYPPFSGTTQSLGDAVREQSSYGTSQGTTETYATSLVMDAEHVTGSIKHTDGEVAGDGPGPISEENTAGVKVVDRDEIGSADTETQESETTGDNIDRLAIIDYINKLGIQSYVVRKDKINDYLKSLFKLAGFLTQTGLCPKAVEDEKCHIAKMIHSYIDDLKRQNKYEEAVDKLKEFVLSAQHFEVLGDDIPKEVQIDMLSTTDTDIDRQFLVAEKKLKNEGIGIKYGQVYGDLRHIIEFKIDVILFANDTGCMGRLMKYAETQYHHLIDVYRSRIRTLTEQQRAKYKNIVNDGDSVSSTDFYLPQTIDRYPMAEDGLLYTNHLYVDEATRGVKIKLNGWEAGLLKEEEKDKDFVCWLRNPDRRSWSLCIPYEKDGHSESMYPDFIVIRKDGPYDYFVDILEPHDPSRNDNVGKAKGLAKYAEKDYDYGRIQLIRKVKTPTGDEGFIRLDMSRSEVRTRVKSISTNDELNHIFDDYGFYM